MNFRAEVIFQDILAASEVEVREFLAHPDMKRVCLDAINGMHQRLSGGAGSYLEKEAAQFEFLQAMVKSAQALNYDEATKLRMVNEVGPKLYVTMQEETFTRRLQQAMDTDPNPRYKGISAREMMAAQGDEEAMDKFQKKLDKQLKKELGLDPWSEFWRKLGFRMPYGKRNGPGF